MPERQLNYQTQNNLIFVYITNIAYSIVCIHRVHQNSKSHDWCNLVPNF